MSHFFRHGNSTQVIAHSEVDISSELSGTHTIRYNEARDEFYLERLDDLELPYGKLYGDTMLQADRILNTFRQRDGSTGALFTGEKGSGKTLLSKLISVKARETGMPTLVINEPHSGDTFNAFLQAIDVPAVVLFDEFEKIYDREEQEKMLTVFDGVYPSKKLFLVTCNDSFRISPQMKNRPGRFYYRIDFGGVDGSFIRAYCADNLAAGRHTDELVQAAERFPVFSFDMLKTTVEEMNRYDESPAQAMRLLNVKLENIDTAKFEVELIVPGKNKLDWIQDSWKGNPFADEATIEYNLVGSDSRRKKARFGPRDLRRVEATRGLYHYENAAGETLSLRRETLSLHDYMDLF